MRFFKPLFFRYLLRQQSIMLVVSFFVCIITNIVVLLAAENETGIWGIFLLIIIIAVWFFPIYLLVVTTMSYLSFKKEIKNIVDEQELFKSMTNKLIRGLVVKHGVRISIFTDKKTDFNKFNAVVNEEVRFQRKKIELLQGK